MINSILSFLFSWQFILTFTLVYLAYELACTYYQNKKDRESAKLRRELLQIKFKKRRSR